MSSNRHGAARQCSTYGNLTARTTGAAQTGQGIRAPSPLATARRLGLGVRVRCPSLGQRPDDANRAAHCDWRLVLHPVSRAPKVPWRRRGVGNSAVRSAVQHSASRAPKVLPSRALMSLAPKRCRQLAERPSGEDTRGGPGRGGETGRNGRGPGRGPEAGRNEGRRRAGTKGGGRPRRGRRRAGTRGGGGPGRRRAGAGKGSGGGQGQGAEAGLDERRRWAGTRGGGGPEREAEAGRGEGRRWAGTRGGGGP